MGLYNYPHLLQTQTGINTFWRSNQLSFFSRCFSRSFLHNQILRLSWCVSSLSVNLISSAGFHDSSSSQSLCGIWLDIFSKMLWFILYILIKLQFLPFQNTIKKNWKDEQGYNFLWVVWQFFTWYLTFWLSVSKYRYWGQGWFGWNRDNTKSIS